MIVKDVLWDVALCSLIQTDYVSEMLTSSTISTMRFLRSIEGKRPKRINNRMKWYKLVLRMNEERIPKKVLNMKVTGKCQRKKDKDGNNRLGKMLQRRRKTVG
jgi:hypothetical protein